MLFSVVFPLLIGSFGVLQNTINKKYAETLGMPAALIVNNIVLLSCSLLLFFAIRLVPSENLPEIFRQKETFTSVGVRHLIPGLLGFFIITCAPWAIERVGAVRVFIGIIAAQVVVSLLWDIFVDAVPVSPTRAVGAVLALVGALLATR